MTRESVLILMWMNWRKTFTWLLAINHCYKVSEKIQFPIRIPFWSYGYTGIVDLEHVNDITGTVMVSLISRRSLFLKEFGKGLGLFGLASLVKENADLCKPLFVENSNANIVNANYIVSVLKPIYSQEGSSRRESEEAVIDNFQDLLMRFEDENLTAYSEMLAWNYEDKLQEREPTETNQLEAEESHGNFQSAVLNPPGVLGWLTGQRKNQIFKMQRCQSMVMIFPSLFCLIMTACRGIHFIPYAFLLSPPAGKQ